MNKNRHRVVFNAARGLRMVVAECARSVGKASSTASTVCTTAILHLTLFAPLLAALPAQAQIAADPSAPGRQRPTILAAPNGVPLVNIQTPSPAGVSRNTYRQFDVNAPGAILNNSRTDVQTQLGGWVPGNPWLATGPARIILNEVNSVNPSYLKGPVEVAGQRAEVIIANPAGIQVNGGSFINASAVNYVSHSPYAKVRRTVSQENARLVNECGANCTAEDFQRIDQQIVALEQAGNLAEIAQRGVMTPQQAQQLAQLAIELMPVYGSGESFLQLITGQSSLTGEEASRVWAAIGMVPVAGGILRKIAEPSAEVLEAVLRNNLYRDGGDPGVVARMYESAAMNSTNNPKAKEVVLGKYIPDDAQSYESVAKQRGATYFEMPDWEDVQGQIGIDKMWIINEAFLAQQVAQEKIFLFTGDPSLAPRGSYLAKERDYLLNLGYQMMETEEGLYRAAKK